MISLIICSRASEINPTFRSDIETKIGYAYEIIIIDNSKNIYNIFQAYNEGVKKSKGDVLCFLHDDVLFHTNDWGDKVIKYFANPEVGAIGIAGTPYLTKAPGSWWAGGLINQQISYREDSELKINTRYFRNKREDTKQVVALDGVWFCVKRKLFERIKFDDESYTGFHFYDIDLSLQITQLGYKIFTIFDIFIEHNSKGSIDENWIENAKKFTEKWRKTLPFSCLKTSFTESCKAELRTIKEFNEIEIGNHFPKNKSNSSAIRRVLNDYRLYFFYLSPRYIFHFLNK